MADKPPPDETEESGHSPSSTEPLTTRDNAVVSTTPTEALLGDEESSPHALDEPLSVAQATGESVVPNAATGDSVGDSDRASESETPSTERSILPESLDVEQHSPNEAVAEDPEPDSGEVEVPRPTADSDFPANSTTPSELHDLPALDGQRTSTSSSRMIKVVDEVIDDPIVSNQVPSTKTERVAWYVYDWANSVYSSVAISAFLPLLVSGLASSHLEGQGIDPRTGCVGYFSSSISGEEGDRGGSCALPSSVATLYISISSFLQMFLFIILTPLADYGNRKGYFVIVTLVGALLTASVGFVTANSAYPTIGWLLVASNSAYGLSVVIYNSFLPPIVANDPRVKAEPDHEKKIGIAEAITNSMSSRGFAAGYAGGMVLLLFALAAIILEVGSSVFGIYRGMLVATGAWWLVFGSITFLYLPGRPLPDLPEGVHLLTFGISKCYHNIQTMSSELPITGIYLLSWFLSSDAISVVGQIGGLFVTDELQLPATVVTGVFVLTPLCSLIGNFFWLWVYNKFNWSSRKCIMVISGLYLLIPAYMFVAYIPGIPLGLEQPPPGESGSLLAAIEMLIVGGFYGQIIGSFLAFSRALFAELIPPGREAEYFGLFEITNKGSSWIAPGYVALLGNAFGTIRAGFFIVALQVLLSMWLLSKVDVPRGRREARASGRRALASAI